MRGGHAAPVVALALGSTLAMTFLLPLELLDPEVRPGLGIAEKEAASKRDTYPQLLHSAGDLGASPRS
jgi:hypothetical protein